LDGDRLIAKAIHLNIKKRTYTDASSGIRNHGPYWGCSIPHPNSLHLPTLRLIQKRR